MKGVVRTPGDSVPRDGRSVCKTLPGLSLWPAGKLGLLPPPEAAEAVTGVTVSVTHWAP